MVTLKNERLVIDVKHPNPDLFLDELTEALLTGVRILCTDAARSTPALDGRELCNAAIPLLDVLHAMVIDKKA